MDVHACHKQCIYTTYPLLYPLRSIRASEFAMASQVRPLSSWLAIERPLRHGSRDGQRSQRGRCAELSSLPSLLPATGWTSMESPIAQLPSTRASVVLWCYGARSSIQYKKPNLELCHILEWVLWVLNSRTLYNLSVCFFNCHVAF